jgi:hypothetical protein
VSDISPHAAGRKAPEGVVVCERHRPTRPPDCRRCTARSWWNGWRIVHPVVPGDGAGAAVRRETHVPLAKCSQCKRGFTCYPPDLYPHRQYQLDVVAEVVASVTVGQASAASSAARIGAGPTSVRRWVKWVADLGRPSELLAAAARIDPDGATAGGLSAAVAWTRPSTARAAEVLLALERLGAAAVRRGLGVVARTGLGRVLLWQLQAHRDVYELVGGARLRLSTAMALG